MKTQPIAVPGNDRAELEATAPKPKPRHFYRPKPPRFLYVLDPEKRFPGTKPNWPRRAA